MIKVFGILLVTILLTLTVLATGANATGLIAYYSFNDGTAQDNSGNGHNGELFGGASIVPGKQGQAVHLDGSGSVNIPNAHGSLDPGNQVTVSCWMKADVNNVVQGIVTTDYYGIEIGGGRNPQIGVIFFVNTNGPFVHTSDKKGEGGIPIPTGEWHHVAGVYDGSSVKLYMDGSLAAETLVSGSIPPMNTDSFLAIGSEMGIRARSYYPSITETRYFKGNIDEVAIYNSALSASEVALLAAGSAPPGSGSTSGSKIAGQGQGVAPQIMVLTGVWSCDDGGTYYIRQLGDTIWWLGEPSTNPDLWSNVARGTISGNTITLEYSDIPKGCAEGYGTLVLEAVSNNVLNAKEKPASYGGSTWTRKASSACPSSTTTIPSSTTTGTGTTVTAPGSQGSVNPWEDPNIRQLIDEWLLQQDKCIKKVYPGVYIEKWGRMCGETETAILSCFDSPVDHPADWDYYHYHWYYNRCPGYYPYKVQEYVKLRQSGKSFDSLVGCKGERESCIA